ncbi:MAG: hypothetical protein IKD31_03845 [Clostridia bacterium]|nr:hypothetical protein [Clostridia bacterium]
MIEPEESANLFYGSFRSGKTSLCEFIQFILFGAESVALARNNAEDALGKITFLFGDRMFIVERSVIGGKEEVSFLDGSTGDAVNTTLTPGEYLTGMDHDSFDAIAYFKQARYETPFFKPRASFLRYLASLNPETASVYADEKAAKKKVTAFCNPDKNGSLDLLLAEKEKLEAELAERPKWVEEEEKSKKTLSEIASKLDENDKRCVLLKADMARFADDLKLTQNKKNAEDLHRSILSKEKKYRIASYDVTHKIGLLSEEELERMKDDYNHLSLSVAALTEARAGLSAAEENLAFHQKLSADLGDLEHFSESRYKLLGSRNKKVILLVLGLMLIFFGAGLFFLLGYLQFDLLPRIAIAAATCLCGIALTSVSTVFSAKVRRILAESGKENVEDFLDYYDKIYAHDMTTQLYLDQVRTQEENCKVKQNEKAAVTRRISEKIASLGYNDQHGELLAICDQIIEANDALYDLYHEIEEETRQYKKLLSEDVQSETLTVSDEFAALQKELSFLSVQNDSLYKKKALLTARLQEARDHLAVDTETAKKKLDEIMAQLRAAEADYTAAHREYTLLKTAREAFELQLKDSLTESINQKLHFILRPEESFLFDDHFELCFCDQKSVLPLISAGGGVISEMGLLAFRVSLAEAMGKNTLPMIFDDSFSTLSFEGAKELFSVMKASCSQFFIATSSKNVLDICSESAKVFRL